MTAGTPNIPENATLAVLIVDLEGLLCIEGSASGFNRSGCNILSHRVGELSEMIGLRVDGLEKMIKGRIINVTNGEAKVAFDFGEHGKGQEKRKERRRPVHIPARVSDLSGTASIHCTITNASRNGCRLEGQGVSHLPDDIFLRISGLDLPVRGNIKWRGPGCAGVQLQWQFTSGKEMKPVLSAVDRARDEQSERTRKVDFGRTSGRAKRAGSDSLGAAGADRQEKARAERELRRLERQANRTKAPAFQPRKKEP